MPPQPYQLAATIVAKKMEAEDLPPGLYEVAGELRLRIRGRIRKGSPAEKQPKKELPWKLVLATLCSQLGIEGADIKAALQKATRRALKTGPMVETLPATEAAIAAAQKLMPALPPTMIAGATKIEDELIEIIDFTPAEIPEAKAG